MTDGAVEELVAESRVVICCGSGGVIGNVSDSTSVPRGSGPSPVPRHSLATIGPKSPAK